MGRAWGLACLLVLAACDRGSEAPAKTEPKVEQPEQPDPKHLEPKIAEAREQLDSLVDDSVNRCMSLAGAAVVDSGVTPPTSLDCYAGPGGRCVPMPADGSFDMDRPGRYSVALWDDSEAWSALGFAMDRAHFFHYRYRSSRSDGCRFTVQAFGDLDGDGVFSTYARTGVVDGEGTELSELTVDRPYE